MPLIPKKRRALTQGDALDILKSGDLATHRQCPAVSKRTGERCKNMLSPGMRTCRMHGSGTKRAKIAAAERIAKASGYAADMLVEFMADPKVDIKLRTTIAQDLLSRANVSGKTAFELEVRAVDETAKRVFINRSMDYDDEDVIDAEVVESYDLPFKPYRAADAIEPPKPVDTEPLPRGRDEIAASTRGPMQTAVPLSHGETYSERSERLYQESRARESGPTRRDPDGTGTRQSTARSGRPKPRNQS